MKVMDEHLAPMPLAHVLQHTLRSLCIHQTSQWVYAVFWRILPRNYPPPKLDVGQGACNRSRANKRNWILAWEDGFCKFASSPDGPSSSSSFPGYENHGLRPDLFFKMSHEIYNYGEGLLGKVATDGSHKWIHDRSSEHEARWSNSAETYPRTWEKQFQSGIKTIALVGVKEGVVQLGAVNEVIEDLNYVVSLRKKFGYIESIPGVLLPHPSCSSQAMSPSGEFEITPSMSSLEALLSKLPSVVPPQQYSPLVETAGFGYVEPSMMSSLSHQQTGFRKVAKVEVDDGQNAHYHDADETCGYLQSSSFHL